MITQDYPVIATDYQLAASAYEIYTLGLAYGNTVAKIIIDRFPDAFSDEVGDEIAKIVDDAIKVNMDYFVANGAERSSLGPYEAAYYAAIRGDFAEHAGLCRAKAAA